MRQWLWASLLLTSTAFALEMGEISVSSGFNQPLVATIPFEPTPGVALSDYKLSLQGLSAGLPLIEAALIESNPNFIKLTSSKPVNFNYIQFDLVTKSKSEELRKGYVITFGKKDIVKTPKPLLYGPIKEGETLWNVAKAFSEHYNIPLDQAMEKLYESNPRAFVKNKKDSLMAGSYLRLPEMHPGSKANKVDQPVVKAQAAAKKTTTTTTTAAAPAAKKTTSTPTAAKATTTKTAEKQPAIPTPSDLKASINKEVAISLPELQELDEEGKLLAMDLNKVTGSLELLVPNQKTGTLPTNEVLNSVLAKTDHEFVSLISEIQSELALSREAIDTERRAKEALQSQLTDLQIQIKALSELIHLKDQEMKTLLSTNAGVQLSFPPETSVHAVAELGGPTALSSLANNQLALLALAVVVASIMVYLGDYFTSRRSAQKLVPASGPTPSKPATIKTQSLQQPPFLLQDIDVYVAHGRYSQAEDMLEQVLSANPNDFDVLYKLFQVYVKSDNRHAYENKLNRISVRWKQKFPTRWKRIQDLYERAWPMGFDGGSSGGSGDDAYEGDPPSDPVQTKLDLAKAYIDIGNHENAVEILIEVVNEGNEAQVLAAQMLLANIKH